LIKNYTERLNFYSLKVQILNSSITSGIADNNVSKSKLLKLD